METKNTITELVRYLGRFRVPCRRNEPFYLDVCVVAVLKPPWSFVALLVSFVFLSDAKKFKTLSLLQLLSTI